MTYEEAISYLHHPPRFPRIPSLDRIQTLMGLLGNPQDSLRFLHIAGTNGKGSVAAMTASILTEAGYRTGRFTSPYLEKFEERIMVDGVPIGPDALCRQVEQIRQAVDKIRQKGIDPTEFDLVTALGFLYFKETRCDFVVLETGLGGQFDSTNVIQAPIAAAITSISKDHTAVLGNDLRQIAKEKCGIIKTGSRVVTTTAQALDVLAIIQSACEEKEIPLVVSPVPSDNNLKRELTRTQFLWQDVWYTILLLGRYQAENALIALQLIQFVREAGFPITKEAERDGLQKTRWPGRLELYSQKPAVLLDAAHNPGGIFQLCQALDDYFPNKKIHSIMGMLSDKEYQTCVSEIAKRCKRFYPVKPPVPGRAVPEEVLETAAASFCPDVRKGVELEDILKQELELWKEDELLLICGSIPLVGTVRSLLKRILPNRED